MQQESEDIVKAFALIRELLKKIDENKSKPMDKKCSQEIIEKYKQLEKLMTFYRNFNDKVLKQEGVTEDEIYQALNPKNKKLSPLVEEADKLRCDVFISQAGFIKEQFKDYAKENRPFTEPSKKNKEKMAFAQKKNVKTKFKTMQERSKWKKL